MVLTQNYIAFDAYETFENVVAASSHQLLREEDPDFSEKKKKKTQAYQRRLSSR